MLFSGNFDRTLTLNGRGETPSPAGYKGTEQYFTRLSIFNEK